MLTSLGITVCFIITYNFPPFLEKEGGGELHSTSKVINHLCTNMGMQVLHTVLLHISYSVDKKNLFKNQELL